MTLSQPDIGVHPNPDQQVQKQATPEQVKVITPSAKTATVLKVIGDALQENNPDPDKLLGDIVDSARVRQPENNFPPANPVSVPSTELDPAAVIAEAELIVAEPITKSGLEKIPLDQPDQILAKLVYYRDPKRIMALPVEEMIQEYGFEGVTAANVAEVITKLRGVGLSENQIYSKLENILPSQLLMSKDYTPNLEEILRAETEAEKNRLRVMPAVEVMTKPPLGYNEYIHTTHTPDTAKQIMTKGLFCNPSDISSTTVELTQDPEQNLETLARRHRNGTIVMDILLPKLDPGLYRQMEGLNIPISTLFIEISPEKVMSLAGTEEEQYVLPARFIRGYFDAKSGVYVQNPNFSPNLAEADRKRIEEDIFFLRAFSRKV